MLTALYYCVRLLYYHSCALPCVACIIITTCNSLFFLSLFPPSHFISSSSGLQLHFSIIVQVTLHSLFSPSLSSYFTTYFPWSFFHSSPPLFSNQPTALPPKKPPPASQSKRSVRSIDQTVIPTGPPISHRCVSGQPIRVFLSRVSCERNKKECSLTLD